MVGDVEDSDTNTVASSSLNSNSNDLHFINKNELELRNSNSFDYKNTNQLECRNTNSVNLKNFNSLDHRNTNSLDSTNTTSLDYRLREILNNEAPSFNPPTHLSEKPLTMPREFISRTSERNISRNLKNRNQSETNKCTPQVDIKCTLDKIKSHDSTSLRSITLPANESEKAHWYHDTCHKTYPSNDYPGGVRRSPRREPASHRSSSLDIRLSRLNTSTTDPSEPLKSVSALGSTVLPQSRHRRQSSVVSTNNSNRLVKPTESSAARVKSLSKLKYENASKVDRYTPTCPINCPKPQPFSFATQSRVGSRRRDSVQRGTSNPAGNENKMPNCHFTSLGSRLTVEEKRKALKVPIYSAHLDKEKYSENRLFEKRDFENSEKNIKCNEKLFELSNLHNFRRPLTEPRSPRLWTSRRSSNPRRNNCM